MYFICHSIFLWLQIFITCGSIEIAGETPIDSIMQGVAMVCISGKQNDSY